MFTRRRQTILTWLIQQIDLLQIIIAVAVFFVDLPAMADIVPKVLLKSTGTQTLIVEKMEE